MPWLEVFQRSHRWSHQGGKATFLGSGCWIVSLTKQTPKNTVWYENVFSIWDCLIGAPWRLSPKIGTKTSLWNASYLCDCDLNPMANFSEFCVENYMINLFYLGKYLQHFKFVVNETLRHVHWNVLFFFYIFRYGRPAQVNLKILGSFRKQIRLFSVHCILFYLIFFFTFKTYLGNVGNGMSSMFA